MVVVKWKERKEERKKERSLSLKVEAVVRLCWKSNDV